MSCTVDSLSVEHTSDFCSKECCRMCSVQAVITAILNFSIIDHYNGNSASQTVIYWETVPLISIFLLSVNSNSRYWISVATKKTWMMWPPHYTTTPLNFCFIYLFFFSRKKVTDYNPALNSYEHFSNDEGIMLSPLTPQIGKMKFILSDTLLLRMFQTSNTEFIRNSNKVSEVELRAYVGGHIP